MASQKTIILLGTGESSKSCDFKDEVWGVNGAYTIYFNIPPHLKKHWRLDKLFMTDYLWSEIGNLSFHIEELNKLAKEWGYKIVSMRRFKLGKDALNCEIYPYDKIVSYFDCDYFTDTITYMIAYALYKNSYLTTSEKGVTRPELKRPLKFRLFGIDMSTTIEFSVSKGGIEFWLGIARAMGAKIEISFGSVILANPRGMPYGFRRELSFANIDPLNIMGWKKRPITGSDKIKSLIAQKGGQFEQGNSSSEQSYIVR